MRRASGLLALLLLLLLSACSQAPAPVLRQELRGEPTAPLVFVPGVLGSKLFVRESGKAAWGTGRAVVLPRDGGYNAALPLTWQQGDPPPDAEATEVVDRVKLMGVRREVYSQVRDLFIRHGYTLGDQKNPQAQDDLFLFSYDYRQDSVAVAGQLHALLDKMRQERGVEVLEVDLLCQSNGALVCRYYTKYGAASLEAALAGDAKPSRRIKVRTLALAGSANGGSLRILREIHRGRQYLALLNVGRRFQPEAIFSFRSLFQELPVDSEDLFVDESGAPIKVDLYDAESWERYGWSVFGSQAQERLARKRARPFFGDLELQRSFLKTQLTRSRQFQHALLTDAPGYAVERLLLIQNTSLPTPRRAVLRRRGAEWQTVFDDERAAKKLPGRVQESLIEMGDGHATVASQQRLSQQEKEALIGPTVVVEGKHADVVLQPKAHHRLLEFYLAGR